MDGKSYYTSLGIYSSFIPIVVMFTILLLGYLLHNPFAISLQLARDRLTLSSDYSTYSKEDNNIDEKSYSPTTNENKAPTESFHVYPFDATTSYPSASIDKESKIKLSPQEQVCDYAKGRWVVDESYPLYSGYRCKQWLSKMWSCRIIKRPDTAYERYRWKPNGCDIPHFNTSAFLTRMRDKTIAFVGDSLGRQQFQSLMCMATGGRETTRVNDVGNEYGFVVPQGAVNPTGWAYRFLDTNTTILCYWSVTLCDIDPLNVTNPQTDFAIHLDRPTNFLVQYLHRLDVLVLNTGHHWSREKFTKNRWVLYVNGKPNEDETLFLDYRNARSFTVYSIVSWLDSQVKSRCPRVNVFFRTISPKHFYNGDWNTGGSCGNDVPLSRGNEVWKDGSSDRVVENAVTGTSVKMLDVTALSDLRDEGHVSRYTIWAAKGVNDCLHWCLPGIPDMWNEILFARL